MRIGRLLLLSVVCLVAGCGWRVTEVGQHDASAIEASIADVIAHPAVYEGKLVRVKGRLDLDFEGTEIFAGTVRLWAQTPTLTERQRRAVDHQEVTVEGSYRPRSADAAQDRSTDPAVDRTTQLRSI